MTTLPLGHLLAVNAHRDPYYPDLTPEEWRHIDGMLIPEERFFEELEKEKRETGDGLRAHQVQERAIVKSIRGKIRDFFLPEGQR